MKGLVEFLEARIAEDESTATLAGGRTWFVRIGTSGYPQAVLSHGDVVLIANTFDGPEWPITTPDHIARFNPARVLAEVDGKRRIIGAWRLESRGDETLPQRTPVAGALLYVIKVHALSYADHPDYLEEWRP